MQRVELYFVASDFPSNKSPNVRDSQNHKSNRHNEVVDFSFFPEAPLLIECVSEGHCRRAYVDINEGQRQNAVIAVNELHNSNVGDGKGVSQQGVGSHERDSG